VFETAEELIEYLVEGGDEWCRQRPHEDPPSREAAERFVKGAGWVPTAVTRGEKVLRGISCAEPEEEEGL
jgi:hypothetical protein